MTFSVITVERRWTVRPMRLIDAHKLQKAFYEHNSVRSVTKETIIGIIKDQPTVDPVQWVLCSDRLPNSEEQVLVTCYDTGGDTAFDYTSCGWVTRNGEYWIVENEMNPYVIAWAPFPKPYKVKK